MATTTITFPNEHLGSGDNVRLRLIFESPSEAEYDAPSNEIAVLHWGKLEWKYKLDDAFLVSGSVDLELCDVEGLLHDLIFDSTAEEQFMVEIQLNENIVFNGYVLEETVDYDMGAKTVRFRAKPKMDIINKTMIYDGTTVLNPFEYTFNTRLPNYSLITFIQDAYQLVNPSIDYNAGSLVVSHNWRWKGVEYIPLHQDPEDGAWMDDGTWREDIEFYSLRVIADAMYNDPTSSFKNVGDVLKRLAIDFGAMTGMIGNDRAFFKGLFQYDASNLQTVPTPLEHHKAYKFPYMDWIRVTSNPGANEYTSQMGTFTELSNRYLDIETFMYYYYFGVGGNNASNVDAHIFEDSHSKYYRIYYAKDDNILSGQYAIGPTFLANFWYVFRGSIRNMRVDTFKFPGVNYDFTKDFNYDESKYQIIQMAIDFANVVTEIEAIYLGAV